MYIIYTDKFKSFETQDEALEFARENSIRLTPFVVLSRIGTKYVFTAELAPEEEEEVS